MFKKKGVEEKIDIMCFNNSKMSRIPKQVTEPGVVVFDTKM